jgi:antirestriction protein ArdC
MGSRFFFQPKPKKEKRMKESVYQIITDCIIGLLEKGTVPWHQPWHGNARLPRNLISNKEYRGINVFLLHAMAYESPFWLTFHQAIQLGGHVRQGERSCPVVFWKWLDGEDKGGGEPKRIPLLRDYAVFNVTQCEGLELHLPKLEQPLRPHTPIETAQQVVNGMPHCPAIKHGMSRASYSPVEDVVSLPRPETFRSGEEYYCVLFHELTHSTGHASRLNRKGVTERTGFGSHTYSKEELVAEMGAAFLCCQAGIVERTIDNSAAYIHEWLKKIKEDARLVVQAAAQAQKATDFILGRKAESEEEGYLNH